MIQYAKNVPKEHFVMVGITCRQMKNIGDIVKKLTIL